MIRARVRPIDALRRRWFGSLQLRVISTTLVLTVTVVVLAGTLLINRVRDGLVGTRVATVVSEASTGIRSAQQLADSSDLVQRPGGGQLIDQIARDLAVRAGNPPVYGIVLLAAPGNSGSAPERSTGNIDEASIPDDLRNSVQQQQGLAWTFTTIRYTDGSSAPGIAVGAPLTVPSVGTYELYYLFPTTGEKSSLDLVRGSIAFAGLLLIGLLLLAVYAVTRFVLSPVRTAADVAERLAAGDLEERMRVRGEDELARLATAFNSMATNIRQQIRQLEALSKVQRRFVADVSHELRTPLTTIRMAADVIAENLEGLDPTTRRAAELLGEQLDRFEALLGELIEISRFDSGQAVLDAEPVDLLLVLDRVLETTAPLAAAKGSAVSLSVPDMACTAEMDAMRVERIVRNLVVNALEHGEGQPVEVAVGCDTDAVAVSVRDHGVGLRPGESSLVFNRFWRSDPSRARTVGGTGLGLSISLEDARLHGGWLEAWGMPARGAVFRLTLPRTVGSDLHSSPLPLEPVSGVGAS
mgnify:FL=1